MHESLAHLFEAAARQYAERELFGTRFQGTWKWLSYGEFAALVAKVRAGLARLGVQPGDRVAIVADNCVEWAALAYATYGRGACYVPMYTAQTPEEWSFILGDCQAKVVFTAAEVHARLKQAIGGLASVERVIGLGLPDADPDSFAALLQAPGEESVPPIYPEPSALAACLYTSGTTGQPKGVELTHRNLCSNCAAVTEVFPLQQERSLAFLPWAHAFGQTAELHFLLQGGHSMAINDDVANLVSNLAEVRPTILIAVPRIFNRIYEGVNRQMREKPGLIRALFRAGLDAAGRLRRGQRLGLRQRIAHALAERLIFSKVRTKFGGRLKLVISGSAALNPEVAEFIDALGILVYEGYGLTETSPVVCVNTPAHRKMGTVGRALPGCRVEIDSSKSDVSGEGELIVYGPNVMPGYHGCPEETAAVLAPDGGFRTGNLASLDADGYITITGRIKELYKLETGKYISPAPLEEQFKLSPFVSNVMLYGANRPYNVALVVPNAEALRKWAEEEGVRLGDVTQNPRVYRLLVEELQARALTCKSYERPGKLAVVTEDFTVANGLLTPKMSLRRREVTRKYQDLLDRLYQAESTPA